MLMRQQLQGFKVLFDDDDDKHLLMGRGLI